MGQAASAMTYGSSDELPALVALGEFAPAIRARLDLLGAESATDVHAALARETPSVLIFGPESARTFGGGFARSKPRTVVVVDEQTMLDALDALDLGVDEVVGEDLSSGDFHEALFPVARVRESSAFHAPRLVDLSAKMATIAQELDDLLRSPAARPVSASQANDRPEPAGAPQVRALIRARRARNQYFPSDLFADPAWDILLDLTAARFEGKQVSVSSLCIAAAVPPTTALRWIKTMSDAGLLERKPDPVDGRRVFIDLADRAVEAMQSYLARAAASPGGLIAT